LFARPTTAGTIHFTAAQAAGVTAKRKSKTPNRCQLQRVVPPRELVTFVKRKIQTHNVSRSSGTPERVASSKLA